MTKQSHVIHMTVLIIDKELKEKIPELELGVIQLNDIKVTKSSDILWNDLQNQGSQLVQQVGSLETLAQLPAVEATRRAYKLLGKDPSRYRGSAEALLRRVISGKPLYKINNVVEINNYISLLSLCPVGSYDGANIKGNVTFRIGKAGEYYKGIGKDIVNLEGLPIFSDEVGPFGSPTSDSEKTMISEKTTNVMTVIISFGGQTETMPSLVEKGKSLFKKYGIVKE